MSSAAASAHELYQAGEIDPAIEALAVELKKNPADGAQREFLIALLCFAGEYERAEKQLDILGNLHPQLSMGALLYRSALHADKIRHEMFLSGDLPSTEPVTDVSGMLNGERFEMLRDADTRIGARLEVYAAGQYTWIPFDKIKRVKMEAPRFLQDLLWAPATVETRDGTDLGEILLPALSPLSNQDDDDLVRLGRVTEWYAAEDGSEIPVGLKMLNMNEQEFPFLEVRELVFDSGEG